MLFRVVDQLQDSPFRALVTLASFFVALVVAITVHEFSHALSATQLGDDTARRQGRLTLSPLAHLDPLGTAMILFAGFGWGRPTPVNPAMLRTGPRSGMALVSIAGPLSNILVATLAAVPINAGLVDSESVGFALFWGNSGEIAGYVLGSLVFWNLLLASFNLIPLAPLDGFKVAVGVLPREAALQFARLERYGPAILLSLIMLSFVVPGLNILASVIRPILNTMAAIVLGGHIW